jgi:2'-5' RNA ligase
MSTPDSVRRDERLRLFVAFRLPGETVRALVRWQADAIGSPRGVRIVLRENLHVTIAFLGARPADELDAIAGALRTSAEGAEPPAVTPISYRETRSVGMLVCDDEGGRATRIAEGIHRRLATLGVYEPEQRPWLPHVTVVRFRERPRLAPPIPDLGVVKLSDCAVMHSVLRPSGAQYKVLESVPVGG